MSDKYIAISIFKADLSKFSFGPDPRPKRGSEYAILYEGKIPNITFDDGISGSDKFMLSSYNGPSKGKVWNNATRNFTEEWDGSYTINFRLASRYDSLNEKEKRVKDVLDHLMKLVSESPFLAELHGDVKCEMMYQPTYIKKEIQGKIQKTRSIDKEKGVYFTVKCSYSAPDNAPKEKGKTGKDEPMKEYRYMSTPFYHPTNGLAKPDNILGKSMKCLPEIYLSYSCVNGKHYLSMRMNKCYYILTSKKSQGPDMNLMSMMVEIANIEEEELKEE